ncbi:MAG: hypothetical protein Q8L86_04605 [Vicinamibacterales bacterium]|nr:hypothetical protein [Vicinamibacterales bacterium]
MMRHALTGLLFCGLIVSPLQMRAGAATEVRYPILLLVETQSEADRWKDDLPSSGVNVEVDILVCGSPMPSVEELRVYAVVLHLARCSDDPDAWGDRLADFVDGGGKVVLPTFAWSVPGSPVGGRLLSPSYSPFAATGATSDAEVGVGEVFEEHPMAWGDTFRLLTSTSRDLVTVNPSATLVASWEDGWPLAAVNAGCTVVGVIVDPTGPEGRMFRTVVVNAYWMLAYFSSAYPEWCVPPSMAISIDVMPGSDINPLNLNGNGVVPVAVLGAPAFDVTTLLSSSIRLGPLGTEAAPERAGQVEDVNGDGHADLVLHFRRASLGIDPATPGGASVVLLLTGETADGRTVNGHDTVSLRPAAQASPAKGKRGPG